jgi:glycosyltransferase involved in cell wall biosynthesis
MNRQPSGKEPWVTCQIGAREHYAVPLALHQMGSLGCMLTDAWAPPGSLGGLLGNRLRERFNPELARAPVVAWTSRLILFEMWARLRRLTGWRLIMARNRWFQKRVLQKLKTETLLGQKLKAEMLKAEIQNAQLSTLNSQPILFSYSYAALEPFRWARRQGWRTVLGQIDPGPKEERIVQAQHDRFPQYGGVWERAPASYWEAWHEECALADWIVVNSSWSRQALLEEGVPASKVVIIPLAYQLPHDSIGSRRDYPPSFSPERPLRALFLGQINLRKGLAAIIEAMDLLGGEPVEFWFVGPVGMRLPANFNGRPRVRFFGAQPRSAAARFYREADVFLFPTMSDGFGLTQLEAQAYRLPVIASSRCGEVVQDGKNGWVLPEVSGQMIARTLRACLAEPTRLGQMAAAAGIPAVFSLQQVGEALLSLTLPEPASSLS